MAIEVTSAMIDAGVAEAKQFTIGGSLSEHVQSVFLAMWGVSNARNDIAAACDWMEKAIARLEAGSAVGDSASPAGFMTAPSGYDLLPVGAAMDTTPFLYVRPVAGPAGVEE